jgi:hypothetical protein
MKTAAGSGGCPAAGSGRRRRRLTVEGSEEGRAMECPESSSASACARFAQSKHGNLPQYKMGSNATEYADHVNGANRRRGEELLYSSILFRRAGNTEREQLRENGRLADLCYDGVEIIFRRGQEP